MPISCQILHFVKDLLNCDAKGVLLPLRGGVVSVLVGGSGMIFFLEAALNCKASFLIRGG